MTIFVTICNIYIFPPPPTNNLDVAFLYPKKTAGMYNNSVKTFIYNYIF